MVLLFTSLLRFVSHRVGSRRPRHSENAVLMKENEILLRKVGRKRVYFSSFDRFFFAFLNRQLTSSTG